MFKPLRLLTLICLTCLSTAYADIGLSITDARIMIAPPGVSVTAGLMTITNDTDKDIKIFSISAEGFEHVEMHKSEVSDGVARMRQEHNVIVPAHGKLILEHGGYHMMLYAPARAFAVGDSIALSLSTSIGEISSSVPVMRHFAN